MTATATKNGSREQLWARFCGILEQAGLIKNRAQTLDFNAEAAIDDLQLHNRVSWTTLNGVLDMLNQSEEKSSKNAAGFWGDDGCRPEAQPSRLGELLQGAGIVSESLMVKAVFEAHATQSPVGSVLMERCLISQAVLDQVLLVQELVREGILGIEAAQQLLKSMHKTRPSASMLMAQESFHLPDGFIRARGLILLVGAGIVNSEDLASAVIMARNMRSDMLTALVFLGYVHSDALTLLWDTLAKLDSDELTLEQAIAALQGPRGRAN